MEKQVMIALELELIKETPQKRITLVRELDKRNIYIKKELKTYNKDIWDCLKQLDLNGIPHIYSIEENEDGLEIIEEYLACQTLADILKEHVFSSIEAYQIIRQLSQILKVLHQQDPKIIHRDIKPENIFYDGKHVTLFDFDIARNYIENQKRDTTVLGSQGYAAPEQFGFYQTDERSDIYSLGVLYHVLLTNQLPRAYDYQGIEKEIIDKMIAIDPQSRYQNVSEIIKDLDRLFYVKPVTQVKKKKSLKHPYALPGFRSGKVWKMIVASIGYIFFIYLLVTFHIEDKKVTNYQYFIYRLIVITWFIVTLFITTNYLSFREYLPYYRNHSIFIKILTSIVSWIVLIFMSVIIGTFLMNIGIAGTL